MNNKFLFSFFLFLFSFAAPAFSASLEELVGAEQAAVLRAADEPVTLVQQKNPRPQLLPRHEELANIVAEIQGSLEPNMLVEALSLYRKTGHLASAEWSKAGQTLLNQLTALSTLAGIQYYSASRNAMRTFYESSFVIDGPSGKEPLPDPVYDTLPEPFSLYARQKDLTFGENVYRYDYRYGDGALFLVQENLTAMTAGIIRAIGKNKFRTVIAVIDTDDSLLIYTAAMAKTVSLPGMGDRIGRSFTNRIIAILRWFNDRAAGIV